MEGFVYFILGAIISIPIAVFAPFITNRVQQRQGERNSRQAERRRQQLAAERAVIQRFAENPSTFTHYLLSRVLFITLVTSFTGLLPTFINLVANGIGAYAETTHTYSLSGFFSIQQWLYTFGALFGIASAVIVIQLASRAIRMYKNVSNYDDYIERTDAEISRLHSNPVSAEAPESNIAVNSSTLPSS
jgi:hypothetical protein